MFMSYPAMNHVEVKLEEIAGGTRLALHHRAIGLIDPAHREGVGKGWNYMLNTIAEQLNGKAAVPRT
jgi:hypothetical protein